MAYCINPESDEPIFCIFEQIGRDDENPTTPYVDGNEFAKELLRMDGQGKKRIQIWINSEGGSVKEGYSIISAMLQTQTKIDVLIIGIAYSIMGIAALCGRKVEMMDFSTLMLHMAYNPDGTADKGLEVINKSLIAAVSSRTGKNEIEVEMIMKATTFYSADEAVKAKLIKPENVIDSGESNAPRKTSETKVKQSFGTKYFNKYLNKVLTTNTIITKTKHMKTVAKALGLNEEASEEAIASEIVKLQNKKTSDEDKICKLEEACKKADTALAEFKKEKETADKVKAKADADADEEAKAKKVVEDKKAKDAFKLTAKAKIELTIKNKGLIIADKAVLNYVDMAGETDESLNKVVETIEAIPSTKTAADIAGAAATNALDKSGISLIETLGTDSKGAPIAGDTSKMISAINSYKFQK